MLPTRSHQTLSCNTMFFFFNNTATTEIYTLSLHDALPISPTAEAEADAGAGPAASAHATIAVDCLLMNARKQRSEEHTSELQSQSNLVCRLLLEKNKRTYSMRSRYTEPCADDIPEAVRIPG